VIRGLRRSLAAKLVAAQLLVILAGSATLLLVALLVAPGLFHSHVRDALGIVPDAVNDHLDRAFADAMLVALGIATGAAVLTAIAVSGFLAVRMLRPIRAMAEGAKGITAGHYEARVPEAGTDELAVLGKAFNEMAASLQTAERRRQELVSDVAHEFRTPLATLEGYVEAMTDGTLPRSDENLDVLAHETRRMARLLEDLSKVSMAEERQLDLRLSVAEPRALIERAAQAAAVAYAEKGVALEALAGVRSAPVLVDVDRIAEVLGNLLANALRHTPPGGRVEIGAATRGGSVEMWVSDTGEGIPPQHLERIFERFHRVDPARARSSGGSGIGLTIARAIVAAHGGRMWAESGGRARGAQFTLALPLATRHVPPPLPDRA
jgi:two-component system, OmpR family, sensor histidine kinase BaeS